MAKITIEDPNVAIRTDNIEGYRIVPATEWVLWAVGAFMVLLGNTGSIVGIIEYIAGGLTILVAIVCTFYVKKVQVLKHGRWITLAAYATPSQASQIVEKLRAVSSTG